MWADELLGGASGQTDLPGPSSAPTVGVKNEIEMKSSNEEDVAASAPTPRCDSEKEKNSVAVPIPIYDAGPNGERLINEIVTNICGTSDNTSPLLGGRSRKRSYVHIDRSVEYRPRIGNVLSNLCNTFGVIDSDFERENDEYKPMDSLVPIGNCLKGHFEKVVNSVIFNDSGIVTIPRSDENGDDNYAPTLVICDYEESAVFNTCKYLKGIMTVVGPDDHWNGAKNNTGTVTFHANSFQSKVLVSLFEFSDILKNNACIRNPVIILGGMKMFVTVGKETIQNAYLRSIRVNRYARLLQDIVREGHPNSRIYVLGYIPWNVHKFLAGARSHLAGLLTLLVENDANTFDILQKKGNNIVFIDICGALDELLHRVVTAVTSTLSRPKESSLAIRNIATNIICPLSGTNDKDNARILDNDIYNQLMEPVISEGKQGDWLSYKLETGTDGLKQACVRPVINHKIANHVVVLVKSSPAFMNMFSDDTHSRDTNHRDQQFDRDNEPFGRDPFGRDPEPYRREAQGFGREYQPFGRQAQEDNRRQQDQPHPQRREDDNQGFGHNRPFKRTRF